MRRASLTLLTLLAAGVLWSAPSAQADEFGFKLFDLTFLNEGGSTATQAGSHPFEVVNTIDFNTTVDSDFGEGVAPVGAAKDVRVDLPAGLVGAPSAMPLCSTALFLFDATHNNTDTAECAPGSQVGVIEYTIGGPDSSNTKSAPIYNLPPPPGTVQKFGFGALGVPVTIEFGLNPEPPYNVIAIPRDIPQPLALFGLRLTVWGNPADPVHDAERGSCLLDPAENLCTANSPNVPFLTLPSACLGPLTVAYRADSWQNPGVFTGGSMLTHDDAEPPNPIGMTGCGKLGFSPGITAQPTTKAANSPTGLDFSLDVQDEGLSNPAGFAQSTIRRAAVTLPEGFTTNPSIAEGLAVCSEEQLSRETASSVPGAGCPNASKVGTVEVQTPLLDESVSGALFIATPYENPVGSLVALYMVIKNANLGIVVKQALKVETDPVTGRITTVADDLPQLPFSHFKLHFREGTGSPLASPPGCGTFNASAVLTPWSGGAPLVTSSAFQIIVGPDSTPCPSGGVPPFHPGFVAGTLNNAAGRYSPFNLRLSRSDSEQEFTHFSIKLPPGIVGKLAGIPFCPDAAIAAAKARTGSHGGQEELDSPSCPAASEVGRTLVGAGVGPSLAYAPGKVYLAGPYHGSALSIAAITAAKVGPFDLGTVVVRQALKINPETAEVFIDATGSDPIPHIIKGIPVHARDIRAYVDRPEFVLNPTSCKRTSTASTVLGAGLDFGSAADDVPVTVSTPFQAADCASLRFAPKLDLGLRGGTKRGNTPRFKAVLHARKGDANIGFAQVTLPHSVFLEQGHIKTICTRVQFAAGAGNGAQCPAASIYGHAKAITPLLDEPVAGPVFLRSSSHPLPDLVAALHSGKIDINLVGQIDSVKGGRIRNTFRATPDAPVTTFTLEMQGGKKSLLVNSTNLCKRDNRALVHLKGQNGKVHDFNPILKPVCRKGKRAG